MIQILEAVRVDSRAARQQKPREAEPALARLALDVAVVGGGLAGLSAALTLASEGRRVALFEAAQAGRRKVCGEFVSPEARATLARLGVLAEVEALSLPVRAARVHTGARSGRSIDLPAPALALPRCDLERVLWRRCQEAGALCFERCSPRLDSPEDDESEGIGAATRRGFVLRAGDRSWHSAILVDATGRAPRAGWRVSAGERNAQERHDQTRRGEPDRKIREAGRGRKFIGIKTHLSGVDLEPGEVAMFPLRGGYCGLVEVAPGVVNACLLLDYEGARRRAPQLLWQELRRGHAALSRITRDARELSPWVATANVRFAPFEPVRAGVLYAGDAAGMIHPLTGDGMAMAMRSGELAAQYALEALALGEPTRAATLYHQRAHAEFDRRLSWARALAPLFCNPRLARLALPVCDALPALAHYIARATRGY